MDTKRDPTSPALRLARKVEEGADGIHLRTPDGYEILIYLEPHDRSSHYAKVCIEAPREVKILREELTRDAD